MKHYLMGKGFSFAYNRMVSYKGLPKGRFIPLWIQEACFVAMQWGLDPERIQAVVGYLIPPNEHTDFPIARFEFITCTHTFDLLILPDYEYSKDGFTRKFAPNPYERDALMTFFNAYEN